MSIQPTRIAAYDQPHQFEPLLPTRQLDELGRRARPVIEAALRLQATAHVSTLQELRGLVRSMNSYYSNRIEGQSTHPVHIARALKADFSTQPDIARRQRLALAHIQAEQALESSIPDELEALHSRSLLLAHQTLYSQLPPEDRRTDEGLAVMPGQLRTQDVTVYRHQPPTHAAVPLFLARADERYAKPWGLEQLLIVAACAHQRLAWVHPFLDGNGRACRLHTHAVLRSLTGGLWSVNRGLARRRDDYYRHLSEADMARQGDLDGRGNLSERMLIAWCEFFIDTCRDQVEFMTRMLDLDDLKDRIAALVTIRAHQRDSPDYRPEAILPLQHVLALGPLTRGEFVQLTGLGERTGRKVLAQLLADGLLQSDTPKGPVRIGFPLDALGVLLPNLYPEAAATMLDY
jgi:Fic family protein